MTLRRLLTLVVFVGAVLCSGCRADEMGGWQSYQLAVGAGNITFEIPGHSGRQVTGLATMTESTALGDFDPRYSSVMIAKSVWGLRKSRIKAPIGSLDFEATVVTLSTSVPVSPESLGLVYDTYFSDLTQFVNEDNARYRESGEMLTKAPERLPYEPVQHSGCHSLLFSADRMRELIVPMTDQHILLVRVSHWTPPGEVALSEMADQAMHRILSSLQVSTCEEGNLD